MSVFGQELSSWGQDYYQHVGVAFELPNHFRKLTALENLAYFSSLYARPTRPAQELLEMVELEHDGRMLVAQLSKGMQGRLNLARALLHDPELLFLDEPTSGQDPVNARRIKELIRTQQQAGKTIFLTTHDMTVAEELCDRVAFLIDGRIALIDSPCALKLRYGQASVRVEYCANQHIEHQELALAGLADNSAFQSVLRAGKLQTIHRAKIFSL